MINYIDFVQYVSSVHFQQLLAFSNSKLRELLMLQGRFNLTWLVLYEAVRSFQRFLNCVQDSWREQMPEYRNYWSQTSFCCRQLRNTQLFFSDRADPHPTFKTITVWPRASVNPVSKLCQRGTELLAVLWAFMVHIWLSLQSTHGSMLSRFFLSK